MDAGTSFALVIIQTELERFKFLVRSFLRSRIAKVCDLLENSIDSFNWTAVLISLLFSD